MDKVEKRFWGYTIFRPWAKLVHRTVHRSVVVNGLENLPKDKPIILAPNHQNALMDAMAIVCTVPAQPVFLARADIFKNKIIEKILVFLKLLPVYRIRDGKDSLHKNEATFNHCVRILKARKVLCLFPEGQHIGMKSMVVHKKAIPRISFLVGEKTNFELDIQIVPVGLNYTHYYNFRRTLVVNYGKPISILPFYAILKEKGERDATLALRNAVFEGLRQEVVHVPDKPNYEIYEEAFEVKSDDVILEQGLKNDPANWVKAEQFITEKLSTYFKENTEEKEVAKQVVSSYRRLKSELRLDEKTVAKGKIGLLGILGRLMLTVLLSPVVVFGALLNGWVFYLSRYPLRKNIKDPQFYSTMSYGVSLFSFLIWYIVVLVITWSIFNWWVAIVVVLLLIPTGIIAWEVGQMLLLLKNRLRFGILRKSNKDKMNEMLEIRQKLKALFEKILK